MNQQVLHILSVCLCSCLSYSTFKAHLFYTAYSCVACLAVAHFSILSHKRKGFRGKNYIEHKRCGLIFSIPLSQIFLILRRIQLDSLIYVNRSSYKVFVSLCLI